jgi:hypothetical protein
MESVAGAESTRVASATRAAGGVYVATGIGFGLGAVFTLVHLARHGELPLTPFGFRAMSGPFEGLGSAWVSVLGWLFVGVCAVETLAGWKLWTGRRNGATIGLLTTPLAVVLGLGFDLPFYLASIPLRLGLLALGRRDPR